MAEHDPIKSWVRTSRAQRRVGQGAICAACQEENRPFALITGSMPSLCFACDRLARGRRPSEEHHVFGECNSDAVATVPVNDHRAALSVAQYDWPPRTLRNPANSPILRAAAHVRGACDLIRYVLEQLQLTAEDLEYVDTLLSEIHGPDWLAKLEAEAHASKERGAERGQ